MWRTITSNQTQNPSDTGADSEQRVIKKKNVYSHSAAVTNYNSSTDGKKSYVELTYTTQLLQS